MNLLQAIILGIIQGLTEFIPISSSGHLILAQKFMGLERHMTAEEITAFVAVIQLGTLAAVIIYFFKDIVSITIGFLGGNITLLKDRNDEIARRETKLGWMIILGSLPIGVIGLLAKDFIEGDTTKNLFVIGISLIVWAFVLWFADGIGSHRKEINQVGIKETLLIGVAQVFALIPGSSRSGTTISGALFAGLTREAAARFSFLLSIPAIAASGLLEMKDALNISQGTSITNLIVATIISGVVGYASIAFLLNYLKRKSMLVFIIYRIVIGMVLLAVATNKG